MKRSILKTFLAALALILTGTPLLAQDEPVPPPKPKAPRTHIIIKKKTPPFTGKEVNINFATKAELKKLPGITDALADKIIAGRPYNTKANLVLHNVLSRNLYEPIKHMISARLDVPPQPKTK